MNAIQSNYESTIFNPRWFLENMCEIITKDHERIKFKLNREQSIMMEHIEFCLYNDLPVRIILLKARQIGATTFFTGLGFWHASMHKNRSYGIVAHRYDSAESIFQKCKVMYNGLEKALQPSTTQFSGDGITFDKKNGKGINSKIRFATVNDGVFRGQTLSFLHMSERAFWEGDINAVDNSLNPTVGNSAGTFIIKESTANGYNIYKDEWDKAVKGESGYTAFFFGWQDHEEYKMKVPKGFVLTEKEELIKSKLNLNDEQMAWRRDKIENAFHGNESGFMQEFPATPEEAFVTSGGSVFPSEVIQEGYLYAKPPLKEIPLQSVVVFEKLKIWEEPRVEMVKNYFQKVVYNTDKKMYEYIDTDIVESEEKRVTPYTVAIDTSGLGEDRNQIVVVDNITKNMVARFGKKVLSEENLARVAVEIAKLYHNAMIVPEVNYSHEICNYILKLDYDNLYITEQIARQDRKILGTIEYGWKTTSLTKPMMISLLRTYITARPDMIPDKEFWYEAEYYLMEDPKTNKMNASSGHHDDIIIAMAIGVYVSCSFQAKQTMMKIKDHHTKSTLEVVPQKNKNRIKLRKGVFNNNA